jgi:predicted helicase
MKIVPRDYQKEAIETITKSLVDSNRATAVMACGTGKTLVALWVAEALQAKTILICMPSLMLIKQTIEVWNEQALFTDYKYMAICCDDKLLDDDEIKIGANECCFDICINTDQVYKFINTEYNGIRLIFSTYQSSYIIPKSITFDLAIFDEAHKTAHKDSKAFRYCLSDDNVTINKRLFLTATPRHYQLRGNKTQLEYSMDNEEVYGPIVYRLDFAQAHSTQTYIFFMLSIISRCSCALRSSVRPLAKAFARCKGLSLP